MSRTAAVDEPVLPMTREEYRAWAEAQPRGRFERINGIVVQRDGASAMAPERASHNLRKGLIFQEMRRAVRAASLPCNVFTDGMTVEVDDSDYEPDAVLRCGPPLPTDATVVSDPMVIVEVLSPSSMTNDRVWKLQEYFRLPSLRHYLIVWPDKPQVVHHRRDDGGLIETQIVTTGPISLDPPGIMIAVDDIYAD